MKIILFQSSNTQRVTINITPGESSILFSKEWKKSSSDPKWILGKSIEIPLDKLKELKEVLRMIDLNQDAIKEGSQDNFLNNLITIGGCEVVQDE